jgi:hypothetical protein
MAPFTANSMPSRNTWRSRALTSFITVGYLRLFTLQYYGVSSRACLRSSLAHLAPGCACSPMACTQTRRLARHGADSFVAEGIGIGGQCELPDLSIPRAPTIRLNISKLLILFSVHGTRMQHARPGQDFISGRVCLLIMSSFAAPPSTAQSRVMARHGTRRVFIHKPMTRQMHPPIERQTAH